MSASPRLRMPSITSHVLAALLVLTLSATTVRPVVAAPKPTSAIAPAPPTFIGPAFARSTDGKLVARKHATASHARSTARAAGYLGDLYIQDGSETAMAVNPGNGNNCVVGYNEGWDFDPDIPIGQTSDGNTSWQLRTFPNGSGIYAGYPFSPWVAAGNAGGEFLSTLIRNDLFPTGNSHIVMSRSTDGGASFSPFYEKNRDVYQDRAMFDVDRTSANGGTTGANDGLIYLTYDDYGPAGGGYAGSYLQVLNASGGEVAEYQISGLGSPPLRGNQLQPVSGITDGTVYLAGVTIGNGGLTITAHFHEIKNGGAGPNVYDKSTMTWFATGQRLGTTTRWGVNGHRIDNHGVLAIDRTAGARRGTLYFLTDRNPNSSNANADQGDLYLSTSTNGGTSWTTTVVPTVGGKTQYSPMMDVDGQGWIHIAYYQNVSGIDHGGVLNAGASAVYYTVSRNGGASWTPPTQVNAPVNGVFMEEPPPDLSGVDYYMIGDYAQIRATDTGAATKVYVVWTSYDKNRTDSDVGDKRERVYSTLIQTPSTPAAPGAWGLAIGVLLAGAGVWALRRRAIA